MSELILFTSEDGQTQMHLRVEGGTIWLSQAEIAELFQTTKQNVSLHAKNILEEGELRSEATVKESLTVQNEGNREVKRSISNYKPRPNPGDRLPGSFATWHSVSPVGHDAPAGILVKRFVLDDQRLSRIEKINSGDTVPTIDCMTT